MPVRRARAFFIYGRDGRNGQLIDSALAMAQDSTLRIIFEDGTWGSTISLTDGIACDLGGTLELTFAPNIDMAALVGTTFDLFNWNGRLAYGDYFSNVTSAPGLEWDLSNLYTTGEVTLTAVPEPAAMVLLGLGGMIFMKKKALNPEARNKFKLPKL